MLSKLRHEINDVTLLKESPEYSSGLIHVDSSDFHLIKFLFTFEEVETSSEKFRFFVSLTQDDICIGE
jgi:hypothetical protein